MALTRSSPAALDGSLKREGFLKNSSNKLRSSADTTGKMSVHVDFSAVPPQALPGQTAPAATPAAQAGVQQEHDANWGLDDYLKSLSLNELKILLGKVLREVHARENSEMHAQGITVSKRLQMATRHINVRPRNL
jgi:hypothetical protein